MKRPLIISVLLSFLSVFPVLGAEKIILVTGEWEPFTSSTMPGNGFFTEIVAAVFKEMGVPFEYLFYPWKRTETTVKVGEAFAGFPYYMTDERKTDYDFSDPVLSTRSRLFFLKSKFPDGVFWETWEDLKGYKIGGALGNWYEPVFKAAGLDVNYAPTDESSFKMLDIERVDMVPTGENVGWELIKKLFPERIADFDTAEKPIKEDTLHLLISKQYPGAGELKAQFNAALKRIQENGVYSDILLKHYLIESE